MKLHEFHVGERHARAVRNRESIASRDDWIRGIAIHLPTTSGS
jgi:hypothetical protein